jgi:hypothetical protein
MFSTTKHPLEINPLTNLFHHLNKKSHKYQNEKDKETSELRRIPDTVVFENNIPRGNNLYFIINAIKDGILFKILQKKKQLLKKKLLKLNKL